MDVLLAMSHLIFLGLDFGPKGDVAPHDNVVHRIYVQHCTNIQFIFVQFSHT